MSFSYALKGSDLLTQGFGVSSVERCSPVIVGGTLSPEP